ncbi:tyrosine-type recombinase/integrase [Terricaulis sp.]|uniref:tyrosine-type recombinase/integrase n=1 Tax=Terricaulis sp. TaxID=2768686 RepID=UPI00378329C2
MALKIYQRPSGIFHLRGTHHGIRVDESTHTRVRSDADAIREKREREIFEQIVLGIARRHSFAEAAIDYMQSGGECRYLEPILVAWLLVEGHKVCFGEMLLDDIDQSVLNQLAKVVKPGVSPATLNRAVFTPVMSVLNYAKHQRAKFRYFGLSVRRPKVVRGRPGYLNPEDVEWWLERSRHLRSILTAYVGTGCRASELINLEWNDVSVDRRSVTLWEEDTKSEAARSVVLQQRVRAVWPERGIGRVFLNSGGSPWGDYRTINTFLWRVTEREVRISADRADHAELKELKRLCRTLPPEQRPHKEYQALVLRVAVEKNVPRLHLHALRHTWATWAYAVTRDITWVKEQGGWTSVDLVHRYMHSGTRDLGAVVQAHGWTMREDASPISVIGKKLGSK